MCPNLSRPCGLLHEPSTKGFCRSAQVTTTREHDVVGEAGRHADVEQSFETSGRKIVVCEQASRQRDAVIGCGGLQQQSGITIRSAMIWLSRVRQSRCPEPYCPRQTLVAQKRDLQQVLRLRKIVLTTKSWTADRKQFFLGQ